MWDGGGELGEFGNEERSVFYEEWFLSSEGAFGECGCEEGADAGVVFLGCVHQIWHSYIQRSGSSTMLGSSETSEKVWEKGYVCTVWRSHEKFCRLGILLFAFFVAMDFPCFAIPGIA